MNESSTPEEDEARLAKHWASLTPDIDALAEQCCDEYHGESGTFQDFEKERPRWVKFAEYLWGLGARPARRSP